MKQINVGDLKVGDRFAFKVGLRSRTCYTVTNSNKGFIEYQDWDDNKFSLNVLKQSSCVILLSRIIDGLRVYQTNGI